MKTTAYTEIFIDGLARIGWALLMVMMLLGVADVVLDLFYGRAVPGEIPLIETLNVMVISFPLLYVTRERRHIVMNLLADHLAGRAKYWTELIATFLTFLFCAVLGWQLCISAFRSTRIMEFELAEINVFVFPAKIILAVGFVGAVAVLLYQIVVELSKKHSADTLPDCDDERK